MLYTTIEFLKFASANNFRFMNVCPKNIQKLKSLCQQGLHAVCLVWFLIPEDNINKLKYYAMGFPIK